MEGSIARCVKPWLESLHPALTALVVGVLPGFSEADAGPDMWLVHSGVGSPELPVLGRY